MTDRCGGTSYLHNRTSFFHDWIEKNGIERGDLIYPEEIPWFRYLFTSIIEHSYKRSNRVMPVIFIITKIKQDDIHICGLTTYRARKTVIIVMCPKFLAWLKSSRPLNRLSESIRILIKVLFHEVYHFKGDCGKEFPEEKDIKSIYLYFRDILDEKVAENENIYYSKEQ